ncbi:MAG: ribonuclease PH [bacterium]
MAARMGREADQLRAVVVESGVQKHAWGSVIFSMGDTRVLCAATVEEAVPAFLKGKGQGWVTAEYGMLPASTEVRTPRDANRGRTSEIQRLIGRSLRAITDLRGLGERTVRIDCDVIQADGGTRTAAINGGFLALVQALVKLMKTGAISRIPIKDQVGAVSVGIVGGNVLLDLDYWEDYRAEVDMNVVMTGSGDLVEIQGTAEDGVFSRSQLEEMLEMAWKGIYKIHELQRAYLPSFQP